MGTRSWYRPGTRRYPISPPDVLTVAEQVSRRQCGLEFDVELAATALDGFITELGDVSADADLYYTVVSVPGPATSGPSDGTQQSM